MARTDYIGAGLAALGEYKIIVPASTTTTQIFTPANVKVGAAYQDGSLVSGNQVARFCRLVCASGTGAVTFFDADTSGHCDAAHTIWSQATTVAGNTFTVDMPIALGLWVTTAASTQVVAIFS